MEETELIEHAKTGDLFAFNDLVLNYQGIVFNLCLRILGEQPMAEDATQDTFISAFKNLHQFKGGSFKSWLLRTASNQCIDQIRKNKRNPKIPLEPTSEDGEEMEDSRWLRDDSNNPAEIIEQNEFADLIQRCIDQLGYDQKVILVLIDVFGMEYKEVQEVLLKPIGTVKSRLVRARDAVRHCLVNLAELYPELNRPKREKTL